MGLGPEKYNAFNKSLEKILLPEDEVLRQLEMAVERAKAVNETPVRKQIIQTTSTHELSRLDEFISSHE